VDLWNTKEIIIIII